MKTIMVLSGGTATAWNICNAIKRVGKDDVKLIVCDINPSYLVHSAMVADKFLEVPAINSKGYYEHMLLLIEQHHVDIIVPLIDMDIKYFHRCSKDLQILNVFSTGPEEKTFNALSNKKNLFRTMSDIGVASPKLFSLEEIFDDIEYFIKPIIGFGSRNVAKMLGSEIKKRDVNKFIIQELCKPIEITADVLINKNKVQCVCRERIETKAGVCTKARVFYDSEIEKKIQIIAEHIPLPEVSCVQFMRNQSDQWLLTDFNLRLGAGSALSAAIGFDIAQSAVALWLNSDNDISMIIPQSEHYVLRYYVELVTR